MPDKRSASQAAYFNKFGQLENAAEKTSDSAPRYLTPELATNWGLKVSKEEWEALLVGQKVALGQEDIQDRRANREHRKDYANRIFYMICVWLAVTLAILLLNGVNLLTLSDRVLITLITTTTANVLVFFTIVIRYLFPSSSTKDPKDPKSRGN